MLKKVGCVYVEERCVLHLLCCAAADTVPDTDHGLWGIQEAPLPPSGLVGREENVEWPPVCLENRTCIMPKHGGSFSEEPKSLFQSCCPFILCTVHWW